VFSHARTVRMWYLPDRKLVNILRGHEDEIEVAICIGIGRSEFFVVKFLCKINTL